MTVVSAEKLQVEWMDSFCKRLTGAITRPLEKTGQLLVFSPGGSIHTCFMAYKLHVFFLDAQCRLLKGCSDVRPWSFVAAPKGTRYVAECAATVPYKTIVPVLSHLISSQ
ncbi:MAG: hypothetical protein ACK5ME_10990 [Parahaliea sp.]